MREYIKSNNLQGFSNTIKTYSVLPASGRADEVVILKMMEFINIKITNGISY